MSFESLESELLAAMKDESLFSDLRLGERIRISRTAEMLIEYSSSGSGRSISPESISTASELIRRIDAHDRRRSDAVRILIKDNRIFGSALIDEIRRFSEGSPADTASSFAGMDGADCFVSKVFGLDSVVENLDPAHPEMIQFEQTPVRAVLHLCEFFPWEDQDVFLDIGCGNGIVPLLVHLTQRVKVIGVDIEASYIKIAEAAARALNVKDAHFLTADAREVDLSFGTVFYLFTPFIGQIRVDVFQKLEKQARSKSIWVCAYGSITQHAERANWLERCIPDPPDSYTMAWYKSVI